MLEADAGLRRLLDVLDSFGIRYMIGGSLASSVYGIPRTTQDVDLVADIPLSQVPEFSAALSSEFYADVAMIEDAIRRGRAFNLIHYASGYKFDIFPVRQDVYYRTQLDRRVHSETVPSGLIGRGFPLVTPEDIILMKLLWYRQGGEVSEHQWTDARGVIEVRHDRLDHDYLRHWAKYLGVEDLLDRLLK